MLIFDRLVLDVSNLDRAIQFYAQVLDFQMVTRSEWMGHQTEAMRKRYRHLHPKDRRTAIESFSLARAAE